MSSFWYLMKERCFAWGSVLNTDSSLGHLAMERTLGYMYPNFEVAALAANTYKSIMLSYREQHWINLVSCTLDHLCPSSEKLIIYTYVILFLGMRTKQQNSVLPETGWLTNLGLVTFES